MIKRVFIGLGIIIFVTLFNLYSCKHEMSDEFNKDSLTIISDSSIGFVLPAYSIPVPELLEQLKRLNQNLIYVARIDTTLRSPLLFSVSKYLSDTIIPMEIFFIEKTIKYNMRNYSYDYHLINFGSYDNKGKRYRYKITKPYDYNGYKTMFFFMKNDLDSIQYEIAVLAKDEYYDYSDLVISKIAESFVFLK